MKRRASSPSRSSKPPGVRRERLTPEGERLQKVLASRGIASRRAAEKLMTEGRVTVDGIAVRELGTRVTADARIEVDGRPLPPLTRRSYFAVHKPLGVVSTVRDPQGRRTVRDLISEPGRLFPVGRLDADSSGLLLMTDDGVWAQRVLHPRYAQTREYEVRARGRITEERLERLRRGVRLDEGISRLRSVRVVRLSPRESVLRVELTQGWKRQVRRTLAAVGLPVSSLVRVRIGPLRLGALAPGEYRRLAAREIDALAAPR
ncbi:MAG TPA: pseudouridine synthase [Candidatus Dormibacteraeota bacterium]|nr:pseudouridine synthase [Candidatus Dormibacteraeota bacterium]